MNPRWQLRPCVNASSFPDADAHWEAFFDNRKVGSFSLWWKHTPALDGEKVGAIGNLQIVDSSQGAALLHLACEQLRAVRCTLAVGPMDGNTWQSYRAITEMGDEPPFFLEMQHPPEWPAQFYAAGFTPLAHYISTVVERLEEDPRMANVEARLQTADVVLRSFRMDEFENELRHIYAVTIASFAQNFLYTPISEVRFLEQYRAIFPLVQPELITLAFQANKPVGFVFAIPDHLETQRGTAATVILKTLAVLPRQRTLAGLGGVLISRVHNTARRLGFRRVIHALMHEKNGSLNWSARFAAKPFRRYVLFARHLS